MRNLSCDRPRQMKQSNRSPPAWLTWNLHPSPNFQRSSHYAAARIPIPQPSHSLRAGVPASNPGRVPTLLQPLTLCRATSITIQRRRRSRSYLPPHSAIFPSRIKFDFHADTACCANNHPYRFHLAFSLLQPPRCLSRASCQSLLIERVNIAIIRAFWNGSLQKLPSVGGPSVPCAYLLQVWSSMLLVLRVSAGQHGHAVAENSTIRNQQDGKCACVQRNASLSEQGPSL